MRIVFSCAALIALSAFARDTAKAIPVLAFHSGTSAAPSYAPVPPAFKPSDPTSEALAPVVVLDPPPRPNPFKRIKSGLASWYGSVLDGHRTASGRRFNMYELTAAHRTLPFGSKVKVTNLRNQRSIVVTITDRGVLDADRVIDLSYGAARQLQMIKSGVDPVTLDLLVARNSPAPVF